MHEHTLADFTLAADKPDLWRARGRMVPKDEAAWGYYRAPLTIERLGEALMGHENADNRRLDDAALAAKELTDFKWLGGGTLVDLTRPEEGRDPEALRKLSDATGLHIVMGAAPGDDAKTLIAEIDRGVGASGIRAGVIGALSIRDPGAKADRARLEAAGRASHVTGAPIALNVADGQAPAAVVLKALDILAKAGADPGHVALGHARYMMRDEKLIAALLQRGVYLAFDQLGNIPTVKTEISDHDVALTLLKLVRAGHGDRILLSQDIDSKIELKAYGGGGYGFILEQYVPYLRGLGLSIDDINKIVTDNPQRFLAFAARQETRS